MVSSRAQLLAVLGISLGGENLRR
jgi:hypothetical protein